MDGDQRGMLRKEKNGAKENPVKSWGQEERINPGENRKTEKEQKYAKWKIEEVESREKKGNEQNRRWLAENVPARKYDCDWQYSPVVL